jgi:predicted HicB family RNase H-like nuclease
MSPSGRVLLRLPTALHAELARRANEQGVSLNALMVALLAGGIGFKLEDER